MMKKNLSFTKMNQVSTLSDLEKIMQADEHIINSNLSKTAKQLVFGSGNLKAKIMFIGEAPGKKEDETGQPFAGQAGEFLNDCLNLIGLNRDDVWITNIVKFRPPFNRDPAPTEKSLHEPYLRQEILIIKPQHIITLGRHAASHFLPNFFISRQHGQSHSIEYNLSNNDNETISIKLWTFYHPAAALYDTNLKAVIREDFLNFKNKVL